VHRACKSDAVRKQSLVFEDALDFAVEYEYKSGTNGTESVGASTLEESSRAFLLYDGLEAVHSARVLPFFLGLFRLHLKAAANSVEGVGNVRSRDSSGLCTYKLGRNTTDTALRLEGVNGVKSIVDTKVCTAEGNNTTDRYTKTVVERENTLGSTSGLSEAVDKTIELFFCRFLRRKQGGYEHNPEGKRCKGNLRQQDHQKQR